MLSRLAGSVYRVGAAVEHTDVTARLLDVYLARRTDAPGPGDRVLCRELRVVVGAAVASTSSLEPERTLDVLALDRHEPASIASAVAVARDDARRAREVVSTELWDCLDVTRARMPRKVAHPKAHEFLTWVRERSALAVGVVEADASRDEVWECFTLGRSLARCMATARLLASDLLDPGAASSWTTVLRACGAGEAFRRDHRQSAPADEAAAFLLSDPHSPRSLRFVAERAGRCLRDIAPAGVSDAVDAFAARVATLAEVPVGGAVEATKPLAAALARAVADVETALADRVFATPAAAH